MENHAPDNVDRPLYIGSRGGTEKWFNGKLDEVAIYNRALSADEILQHCTPLPGIIVNPTSGLVTTEAGGQDTFTVVLMTQPTSDVTIDLSSSDTSEGTVSPTSLTSSTSNWDSPQAVTITGANDDAVDGPIAYTIETAATSADTGYNGYDDDEFQFCWRMSDFSDFYEFVIKEYPAGSGNEYLKFQKFVDGSVLETIEDSI